MRNDYTMLGFGENGYVQTSEGGDAARFGPVMAHNILVNFSLADVDLKPFLGSISDEDFEEICRHLNTIHGTSGKLFKRLDRLNAYTSARYIVRDACQIQQRTLRKRLPPQTSLK
jgi:hypothetical protein